MRKAQEEVERARQEGTTPPNPEASRWWRGDSTSGTKDFEGRSKNRWMGPETPAWTPSPQREVVVAVDVEEYDDSYALWMDVPGLQKDDLKVPPFPTPTIVLSQILCLHLCFCILQFSDMA